MENYVRNAIYGYVMYAI